MTSAAVPARSWIGWTIALSSVVCFSIVTPISKVALTLGLNPATQNSIRFGLAAALLGLTLLATNPAAFRLARRGLLISLAAGGLVGLGSLIYLGGLEHIDASVAAMIFSLEPLLVLGLLSLRGERFTRRQLLRLGLALSGVYLLVGPSGQVDLLGAGLVALSTLTFAAPMALIQWFLSAYDSRATTFYMVAGMWLVNAAWWLVTGREWHDPGGQGWAAILSIALVSTYGARLLMVAAIRRLGSGQVALLGPVEMMLTVLWTVLFLGERLTAFQAGGGALILASACLAVLPVRRRLGPFSPRPPATPR